MSGTKVIFALAGTTLVAGAVGYVVGTLFAPASGTKLRRRLAWTTEERWREVTRATERLLERARAVAAAELSELKKRCAESTTAAA